MELLAGGSLRTLMETGRANHQRMSVNAIAQFAQHAALGLGAAHAVDIVHRDIKPANLMIDREGKIKVADFGVVLALERATWLTGLGRQIGTPAYMSPEQCKGERVGPPSDIYSLGVTMFELATNELPYREEAGSPFALMLKHIHEPPPDPRKLRENLPNWLTWIILTCLDKNPAQRYRNGNALAEAIATAPRQPDLMAGKSEEPRTVWRVNTVAIREQLKRLPQRSIVAWACRCARRVQHLNSDPRLERSITMAESAISDPDTMRSQQSLTHALQRVQRLRTASFRAAYVDTGAKTEGSASLAALAAAGAAATAASGSVVDAAADAAFVAQTAVTALERAGEPVAEFWKWAQRDYQRLRVADLGAEGTPGKPIPRSFWTHSE
jgi:serine/threonine protein kinase